MCFGVTGRIVEIIDPANGLVRVDVQGVHRDISLGLLGEEVTVGVDDWVLVHMGFAMEKLDRETATEADRLLEELIRSYDDDLDLPDAGVDRQR